MAPPVEENMQAFLERQPGPLKSYAEGGKSAAQLISGASIYYDLSPRVLLALLETSSSLLSDAAARPERLRRPFGASGPEGFAAQLDWAASELRAGLGPYERPPTLRFTDGTTLTLTLAQAPEGVAVQRFLAPGRTQAEWRMAVARFGDVFAEYFKNELPRPAPPAPFEGGFLQLPWPEGARVVHLAYFDHMFPTVDTNAPDNGYVVNFRGQGNMQYDGHDGHDYYFPDRPVGTYIYAAADGIAHASTHRGNGVWIEHAGGYVTVYWHLDKFSRRFEGKINSGAGVPVRAGDLIGSSGRSGFVGGNPHLHFEVRHNGRQVDPYGWYGPGADPCVAYAACEASTWLWAPGLLGTYDFTPPTQRAPDTTAPNATLTLNPQPGLRLLAHFDGSALQQVGAGAPIVAGAPAYPATDGGAGVLIGENDRLAFPSASNIVTASGTIAAWVTLPQSYPANRRMRSYLLSSSANPDSSPVYTNTLALRREVEPGGAARWNFWTTPASGEAGRNELLAPDTLAPGRHHLAITWDRQAGAKALYLDGQLAAAAAGLELPSEFAATIDLGRFGAGGAPGGIVIDDLAIFDRALDAAEIARMAADALGQATTSVTTQRQITLDLNASDDSGGIVRVEIGVNGVFGDPQPFADAFSLELPDQPGLYTVGVRLYDRAGNRAVVEQAIQLAPPAQLLPTP
jgi:murein DD-endopeptidase MepM/ murein hydrolase activator NlpD